MTRVKRLGLNLLLGSAFLWSSAAIAENVWSGAFFVDEITLTESGAQIRPNRRTRGCNLFRAYPGKNKMTSSLLNQNLALLLLAADSDRKVRVQFNNSSSKCYIKQIRLIVN